MKTKKIMALLLAAVLMLALIAACGNGAADPAPTPQPGVTDPATPPVGTDDDGDEDENGEDAPPPPPPPAGAIHPGLAAMDGLVERFGATLVNPAPILQPGDAGNTLRILVGSSSTFPGLFNTVLSSEAFDSQIMDFQMSPLVSLDGTFMWTDDGIATLRFDNDNTVVELNMQRDVYWHDGTPLTLDDLVFAYELMSHPEEETGIRYGATHFVSWVVGIEEWRDGTADHISGMVLSNNNRTLRIYYDRQLPPGAQYAGSVWLTPTPRHHLEPAIAEVGWGGLAEHPRARHEALGFGPWIIESIVPGESVLFRANDNYHRGRPNIDSLLWQIRPLEIFMAAMREGEYDIVTTFGAVHFEEHELFNPNNYQVLAMPGTGTGFLYFRTGTFVDGLVVPRAPGWHPIQDVAIRRALAHAMPQQLIADTIQNGLSIPAGTVLSPFNARTHINPTIGGAEGMFPFDLDVARMILDEAGYTAFGPDGFRLDLDGNPMEFYFAANDNAFNREAVPTYLSYWREVGLDVRIYTGDLIDWGTFLENVLLSDNWSDNIHMFISNWTLGMNPAPHGLWNYDAAFNMARHMSDEMRGILDDINSQDAFDAAFLQDAYDRWQIYFAENAVAQHMFWGISMIPVNNRVANFTLVRESGLHGWVQRSHLFGLTAPTPYANTN